jgi:hypothetical protein
MPAALGFTSQFGPNPKPKWCDLPPKPVANPTVPSVASISRKKDPRTLIPQLVLDVRYFSHWEHGVEMGESISLFKSAYRLTAIEVSGPYQ